MLYDILSVNNNNNRLLSSLSHWLLHVSICVYCTSMHPNTYPMNWHVLWHVLWHVFVLNACQCIFNTNRNVLNIYPSVLVCIVFKFVLCLYGIIICANTDLIHTTVHAQYWGNRLVCITIHANIYQHIFTCSVPVLVIGLK